jgi:hypothetical protein
MPGYLQHGWNVLHGFGTRQPFHPGWPRFLWSDGPRRRGLAMDTQPSYVIGAPWNYLLALEEEPQSPQRRTGTLWYPFHGWEHQKVIGDHDGLIEEIKEVETEPVTVCLYWLEYRQPDIKALYEEAGFRVISHGYRGLNRRNTDPDFLRNQLGELRKHRRVASNRLSTAIFYGLSAGCEAAVYGDPMEIEKTSAIFGGVPRLHQLWPELHGAETDQHVAREIAAAELGSDFLAEPEELRELFRWQNLENA